MDIQRNNHGGNMLPENYYEVLGLKKFADINEVQAAYRKTVKFVHPDVSGDLSKEVYDYDPLEERCLCSFGNSCVCFLAELLIKNRF